jgi:pimeloyl-ACP methyl ester carboxylesterase
MTGRRDEPRSLHLPAADGLLLHLLEWGSAASPRLPVLCLPGLARTADDFRVLGAALSGRDGRRVIAVDYRGRGGSGRDPDPARYTVAVEAADVLAVCDALAIRRAAVVGTSRGGLVAMLLAVIRPELLAGVVLNDIGPVIEPAGLARIRSYVGKLAPPRNWAEAGRLLAAVQGPQFPALRQADWEHRARLTWSEEAGALALRYDPRLAESLAAADIPPLWGAFDRFGKTPVLVVRGALSDLLSAETVAAMAARLPRVESWVVAEEGHAPLLEDSPTIDRIARFIDEVESPPSI